jgi:hypothetical protein
MASTNQTWKTWIFDTTASSHMTSDKNTVTDIREYGGFVRVANSQRMKVTGIGKVHLQCRLQHGSTQPATLEDGLPGPDLDSHGLFSWEAISRKGFKMIGYGKNIELETKEGRTVLWAKMEDKDPVIQLVSEDKARLVAYKQWHEALGHTSKINADMYADGHLLPKTPNDFHCTECYLSKNVKHVPPTTENQSFELIHSDLSSKFSVPSLGKSLYYMTFIDDKSRFAWVYLLKNKSDAAKAIKDFVRKAERQHKTKILRFRTDNGGEYVNKEIETFFSESRISHNRTVPYWCQFKPPSIHINVRLQASLLKTLQATLFHSSSNTTDRYENINIPPGYHTYDLPAEAVPFAVGAERSPLIETFLRPTLPHVIEELSRS